LDCYTVQEFVVRLTLRIAAAILDPPAATPALKRAARRYRELFGVK